MNSNYNDIIDIILTLTEDEEIRNNVAVSGSIVPYLISNRESKEYHDDFYIYVKEKSIGSIRNKIKKLSKKYQMDIVADSIKCGGDDFGFKVKYQDTAIGFFPYSLIDNNLVIKTFNIDIENKEIKLKSKKIKGVYKDNIIRSIILSDKKIRIMSPEFILAQKEVKEKESDDKDYILLLNKIADPSVLKSVRESMLNMKVNIETKKIKDGISILSIILVLLLLTLIVIAFICFKK